MNQIVDEFRRYAALIERMLAPATRFAPEAEGATAVQVERGGAFVEALAGTAAPDTVDRLIELARSPRLPGIAVVDRSGHHRPVYRALMVYSWLRAFGIVYETLPRSEFGRWEEGLRAWCDLLESELGEIEWPPDAMPAGHGASATEAAMTALALHAAGKLFVRDAWTDLASDTFGRLSKRQQAGGAFLLARPADNPETHWYHELVILHAAASYAVQSEDRPLASAVARAACWHLNETQPDHATSQPWAVFAFLWNESTRTLAEHTLHALHAGATPGIGGVSLMLLADALYCLRLFESPPR